MSLSLNEKPLELPMVTGEPADLVTAMGRLPPFVSISKATPYHDPESIYVQLGRLLVSNRRNGDMAFRWEKLIPVTPCSENREVMCPSPQSHTVDLRVADFVWRRRTKAMLDFSQIDIMLNGGMDGPVITITPFTCATDGVTQLSLAQESGCFDDVTGIVYRHIRNAAQGVAIERELYVIDTRELAAEYDIPLETVEERLMSLRLTGYLDFAQCAVSHRYNH